MNLQQIFILCLLVVAMNFLWDSFNKKESNTSIQNIDALSTDHNNEKETSNSNIAKYFFTGIALFSLFGGLWGVNHWFNDYNTATDSVNWTVYDGKMLEKSIGNNTLSASEDRQRSGRTYCPKVKYEFSYKNKIITWDRIDYLNRVCSGDSTISDEVLMKLPNPGKKVIVFFSPEKKQAVLIP